MNHRHTQRYPLGNCWMALRLLSLVVAVLRSYACGGVGNRWEFCIALLFIIAFSPRHLHRTTYHTTTAAGVRRPRLSCGMLPRYAPHLAATWVQTGPGVPFGWAAAWGCRSGR